MMEEMPEKWQHIIVVPVYKKDDIQKAEKCREISLNI
jgi:hypothetical protein